MPTGEKIQEGKVGERIGGEANETGFMIYKISGMGIKIIKVKTKGYQEPVEIKRWTRILTFALTVFFAGAWAGIFYIFGMISLRPALIERIVVSGVLATVVSIIALIFLDILLPLFLRKRLEKRWEKELIQLREEHPEKWRALAEYHACEHKLIHLLKEEKKVNLENLQAVPSSSPWCGLKEYQQLALVEPSLEKLMEAIEIGQEYLRRKKKNKSP